MTLTFTYANGSKPIAGVKVIMTESDGTVTVLVTNSSGQITLPSTSNTYTLSASLNETGDDPISLIDAIQILQYSGELRTLTEDQKTAADVNNDGEVDVLDAIWILQHQGELRTINQQLVFLDANTGKVLSETTFAPEDSPTITVIRMGDVDQDFDPSLITDHVPILTGKTTLLMTENETSVSTLIGSDADGDALTYSITGGADQSLFTIDEITGLLTFKAGPDYEDPKDSDGDNLYEIEISVSDGTNTSAQALIVSVVTINNTYKGTSADEMFSGSSLNDQIKSGGGNDIINAGYGHDVLILPGNKSAYTILTSGGLTKIYGTGTAPNGYMYKTVRIIEVESIQFDDQKVTVSTDTTSPTDYIIIDNSTWGGSHLLSSRDDIIDFIGNDLNGAFFNERWDGGEGTDTIVYFEYKSFFDLITVGGITKIKSNTNGTDVGNLTVTCINIEKVAFFNQTVLLDTALPSGTFIWGSQFSDTIYGTVGDDIIDSAGGADTIDGSFGNDTLLLFGNRSEFSITVDGNTVNITGNTIGSTYWLSYYGDTITLNNVETIMFADQTVSVSDLTSQESSTGKPMDSVTDIEDNESDNSKMDDNALSDVDLWANEFDLNSFTLPETVLDNLSESVDFIDVNESLEFESDSLAINFDAFLEDSVLADIQPVKIVPAVTYHAAMEYHENSSIEDLVYSSELG